MAKEKSTKNKQNDANLKNHDGRLLVLLLYLAIVGYYLFTAVVHRRRIGTNVKNGHKNEPLKAMKSFKFYFFTGWNFTLQIIFLMLAVTDEASKLAKLSKIQRLIEKTRLYLFSTLVFPSSLLVMSVFWSIWHIDRELIFPKIIDEFYPPWLNHTLHTFIVIPLIVEILAQFKNVNYRISRKQAGLVLLVYCSIYQLMYLSIYLKHGVWLYPVYKVLSWTQRISFTLLQLLLIILYQQIGISLLKGRTPPKTKAK